jgi:uncharacterized surface protein with fasciclin (FAS1) repeats
MKLSFRMAVIATATLLGFSNLSAQTIAAKSAITVMVGGEAMFPMKNIVQNAINSKAHTTLVAAVQAADLVDVLQSAGPFTVFAPVNDAFENLPAGTVETLLKPENKATLQKVLTYHVVKGKYDFDALAVLIAKLPYYVVLNPIFT